MVHNFAGIAKLRIISNLKLRTKRICAPEKKDFVLLNNKIISTNKYRAAAV